MIIWTKRGSRMTALVRSLLRGLAAGAALLAVFSAAKAGEDRVLTITSTEPMTIRNPYGESSNQTYSLWCEVYGCLGTYDWTQKKYVGMLVDRWETIDPLTWRFHLRAGLRRNDGGPPPTSADVIHSWRRILDDPDSAQRSFVSTIKDIAAVDDQTFDIHTKAPTAPLLSYLFDRLAITSAELYKQYGKEADVKAPFGWGPYKLDEFSVDQRVVVSRADNWPELDKRMPRVAIWRQIKEPQQRVTALLNNEVQIARLIPPQLVSQVDNRPDITSYKIASTELMFIALNPTFKPWDDMRVRQAASHAIDRDLIIKKLLGGLATRLDGPLGPDQVCYTGPIEGAYKYDPELSRKLLAEAGYKEGGPEIDFTSANGRYVSDVQIAEAVTQMLQKVGFKVTLHTPDYPNMWANVRAGKLPMFYMGRGGVVDPSDALAQFFQTGITPRIHYSNPKVDTLLAQERAEFDPAKRCATIRQADEIIVNEAPAIFMWTHKFVTGVRKGVRFEPNPDGEVWMPNVRM
jgi:peptide/nickel transport system substrate-binding protein